MADNKVIAELNGRLVGDGYTLPIATTTRLGVIMVGEGLAINSNGLLKVNKSELMQKTYSKIFIKYTGGTVNKSATIPDDIIKFSFGNALKVQDINNIIDLNLDFGSYLDDDKPMTGTAIKEYLDSVTKELRLDIGKLEELRLELDELEDLLADMYLSSIKCISTEVYELETDDSGYAAIPFTLEENQRSYVFINGLFAVEGKDYQIADNNIQLMSSEFVSNNDVVTFVVIKSMIDGKTGESREINVSSEIYEVTTNAEGYARLPFNYNNQAFHVFINGMFAVAEKDYQINGEGVQLTSLEFGSGEDVITFVVFKATDSSVGNNEENILTELYEVETDDTGHANIPLMPKMIINKFGSTAVHVYINGIFAVEGEDYTIENGNIQLTSLEFGSGSDVITFVVLKAGVVSGSGGTVDEEEISVSDIENMVSEIDGLK